MERRPAGPARFLKPQYITAAFVAALIVVLSVTGFVWAEKGVIVVVDGESRPLNSSSATVGALLAEAGIHVAEGDVVTPSPDAALTDGMTIVVRHAVPITLSMQGGEITVPVVGETVADALVTAGIDPSSGVVSQPPLTTELSPGMTVTVDDVFVRIIREEAEVPFEVVHEDDATISSGSRKVTREGVPGKLLRVYRVLVTNGLEGQKVLTAEEVVQEPVDEVVSVGTKRSSSYIVAARSGSGSTAKRDIPEPPADGTTMRVTATAYAPGVDGVGTHTATGVKARYGIAAVDPTVIPLGTRFYVPGYGYAVAADTGSAIKGARVDLCFGTRAEALAWGRRSVTITIVK